MREAWVQLYCSGCDEHWQANPKDLPPPKEKFTCPHCERTDTAAAFMATAHGLDILKGVHEE